MQSMTGFSTAEGAAAGRRWRWEAKSVNGRGLDLRFRIADGFPISEPTLRGVAAKCLKRGSITVQLRADGADGLETAKFNEALFAEIAAAAVKAEIIARDMGLSPAPVRIDGLLQIRGVFENGDAAATGDAAEALEAALVATFEDLMQRLIASRGEEGAHLKTTISGLIDEIERLSGVAAAAFDASHQAAPDRLREKVAELTAAGADAPGDRLAQELALLAVKADVREELDRLSAHVQAARALIESKGPIGRKLDFLTQEFNREANTLCSKSGSTDLTQAGLDLKVAIDQLREQAQNVE